MRALPIVLSAAAWLPAQEPAARPEPEAAQEPRTEACASGGLTWGLRATAWLCPALDEVDDEGVSSDDGRPGATLDVTVGPRCEGWSWLALGGAFIRSHAAGDLVGATSGRTREASYGVYGLRTGAALRGPVGGNGVFVEFGGVLEAGMGELAFDDADTVNSSRGLYGSLAAEARLGRVVGRVELALAVSWSVFRGRTEVRGPLGEDTWTVAGDGFGAGLGLGWRF